MLVLGQPPSVLLRKAYCNISKRLFYVRMKEGKGEWFKNMAIKFRVVGQIYRYLV